ncbi:hypothetical protein ACFSW8_02665 [Rubritalea tangerina]|uniref:DUF2007 domain-containing protein n=1 Tax=Rubritalea tangerina TaxID=430798 RepID=A0ABW4Z732_9BACT
MITIAKYSTLADAQKDADRLSRRDIEVHISESGLGGVIGGGVPSFELQVYEEDLEKLEVLQDEIQQEIEDDRPYACPNCNSKNYIENTQTRGFLASLFSMGSARGDLRAGVLRFKCLDCEAAFKITIA